LAFIPARGGSKSIPLKNLAKIKGKPLLFYTLNQIINNRDIFDDVICSTDHPKIKEYVESFEIEVLDRPEHLSKDSSSSESAILHCLDFLKKNHRNLPDFIFLFQPTSPFVNKEHIKKIINKIENTKNFESILTISRVSHNNHAFNQRKIKGDFVDFIFKSERSKMYNKQSKPNFYKFGNLICLKTEPFLKNRKVFGDKNLWIEIPEKNSLDIESIDDIKYAEFLIDSGILKN
jgi:CMP-N,N'-diacetyllegionaminic acid synthase